MAERLLADGQIKISMLGTLFVETAGGFLHPSDFGGHKPRQLLERLVLARNSPVSKDALAAALWPVKPPKNVDATLENYVSILRRLIFADRFEAQRLLVTTDRGYWLRNDLLDLDVDRFDDWIKRAEASLSLRRNLECRLEAAAIARGEFCEDSKDEAWVLAEGSRYRQAVTQNLLAIAEIQLTRGDLTGALRHGETVLAMEPFSEEAARLVMVAHSAMGHETSARQAYERCRSLIRQEFDQDCTSATDELAAAIDAGETAAALIAAVVDDPHSKTQYRSPQSSDRRGHGRQLGFIGRERQLETLDAVVDQGLSGRMTTALISGRRGMGKSALLDRIEERHGVLVGRVSYAQLPSTRRQRQLPLVGVILDALERRNASHLADAYTAGPFLKCDEHSLAALLDVLSACGPMVFLLDDLHLADEDTIAAVDWLGKHASDVPLAIIATSDGDKLPCPPEHPGCPDFDELIVLDALTTQEVAPFGSEVDEMRSLCGGCPMLMADLWRWRSSGSDGLPPSLREVIKGRLRSLQPSQIETLEAMARRSEPVCPNDLKRELDVPIKTVRSSLEKLSFEAFVIQLSDGVHFQAPVVRQVLTDIVHARKEHVGARRLLAS